MSDVSYYLDQVLDYRIHLEPSQQHMSPNSPGTMTMPGRITSLSPQRPPISVTSRAISQEIANVSNTVSRLHDLNHSLPIIGSENASTSATATPANGNALTSIACDPDKSESPRWLHWQSMLLACCLCLGIIAVVALTVYAKRHWMCVHATIRKEDQSESDTVNVQEVIQRNDADKPEFGMIAIDPPTKKDGVANLMREDVVFETPNTEVEGEPSVPNSEIENLNLERSICQSAPILTLSAR